MNINLCKLFKVNEDEEFKINSEYKCKLLKTIQCIEQKLGVV